jgi:hypothetical protein
MINIAFYTTDPNWYGNQMFDVNGPANTNHVSVRWAALREYLLPRGYALNTHDTYNDLSKIDLWYLQDLGLNQLAFLIKQCVRPRQIILSLHESPVVMPWGLRLYPLLRYFVRGTLTWHTAVGRNDPYLHRYHIPTHLELSRRETYLESKNTGFLLMMHSNRMSRCSGELYTLRRRILEYFDARDDGLLNLYGHDWNDDTSPIPFHTRSLRGTTEDKHLTYAQHRFALCLDNCVAPGYIQYDPFISMAVGTVPVYLPMPDAHLSIPQDTYINFNDFDSFEAMVDRLKAVAADPEIYEGYRQRGWEFITSEAFEPFTIGSFCREVHAGIDAIWNRR